MPSTYDGIVAATAKNMKIPHPVQMPDYESYLETCRQMRDYIDGLSDSASDMSARGIEFHSFGVSGWQGGETIAPMIWSIGNLSNFFSRMINAQTGLVMTSFFEPILASEFLETVYTANKTSHAVYNEIDDSPTIGNIVNLGWSQLTTSIPVIDIAHVAVFDLVDERVCSTIVNAVRPGGMLIVANSSNGGELYNSPHGNTFAQEIHDEIHLLASFKSFHFQGYISYTVFIKDDI